MISLLRLIEQSEANEKLSHLEFKPLIYLPVKVEIIETIRFEIKNELLKYIVFTSNSVVKVSLHFRKRVLQ